MWVCFSLSVGPNNQDLFSPLFRCCQFIFFEKKKCTTKNKDFSPLKHSSGSTNGISVHLHSAKQLTSARIQQEMQQPSTSNLDIHVLCELLCVDKSFKLTSF